MSSGSTVNVRSKVKVAWLHHISGCVVPRPTCDLNVQGHNCQWSRVKVTRSKSNRLPKQRQVDSHQHQVASFWVLP